jgi:membrane-bound ClpP family serine protease
MASEHSHKVTSWVTVMIIVVGCVLLGLALPLSSLVLGIVGAVVVVVGGVFGLMTGLMDDAY